MDQECIACLNFFLKIDEGRKLSTRDVVLEYEEYFSHLTLAVARDSLDLI